MKKIFLFAILVAFILISSSAFAYTCIHESDNQQVKYFKSTLNLLSIKSDLSNGLNEQQILTKLKYFGPCRR